MMNSTKILMSKVSDYMDDTKPMADIDDLVDIEARQEVEPSIELFDVEQLKPVSIKLADIITKKVVAAYKTSTEKHKTTTHKLDLAINNTPFNSKTSTEDWLELLVTPDVYSPIRVTKWDRSSPSAFPEIGMVIREGNMQQNFMAASEEELNGLFQSCFAQAFETIMIHSSLPLNDAAKQVHHWANKTQGVKFLDKLEEHMLMDGTFAQQSEKIEYNREKLQEKLKELESVNLVSADVSIISTLARKEYQARQDWTTEPNQVTRAFEEMMKSVFMEVLPLDPKTGPMDTTFAQANFLCKQTFQAKLEKRRLDEAADPIPSTRRMPRRLKL